MNLRSICRNPRWFRRQRGSREQCCRDGFTLIELVVVVAVLAVLALVAVANLAGATDRAKVSRAKNDLRVLAVGLEAYRVDANAYPEPIRVLWSSVQLATQILTTPVAYLSALPVDGFDESGFITPTRMKYYMWTGEEEGGADRLKWYGHWMVASHGPDRRWNGGAFPYDPTNGSISAGDIVWRQNEHLRTNK